MRLPYEHTAVQIWSRYLAASYRHWRQQELVTVDDAASLASGLFEASQVIVSHDTQADPIFNYANRCALQLWPTNWNSFIQLPSRLSAEPMHREARDRMLAQLETQGFVDNYAGIRISSQGRRFHIKQAIIWNVIDDTGRHIGQAATFQNWTFL